MTYEKLYYDGGWQSSTSSETVADLSMSTVSSYRLRGYTRPSYNVIEVTADEVRVTLKYPGTGERLAGVLDRRQMALASSPDLAGMFTKSSWRP